MQRVNWHIILIVWLQFIANYIINTKLATLGESIIGVKTAKIWSKEDPDQTRQNVASDQGLRGFL